MITYTSQGRMSMLKVFTWRSRGLPVAIPHQATDRDAYEIVYQRMTHYSRTVYWTECKSTIPEAYQMTTEKHTDIQSKLPTEMATGRTCSLRPNQMLNQDMPKSAYSTYNAAFQVQKCTTITVSMAIYCEAYLLDTDQWYTAHADANGAFCHPEMVTSKSHENPRLLRWQEQKLTSLPKVKTRCHCKWRRDWAHWDTSYDSKSTGITGHDRA